jgi:hypothetical protein
MLMVAQDRLAPANHRCKGVKERKARMSWQIDSRPAEEQEERKRKRIAVSHIAFGRQFLPVPTADRRPEGKTEAAATACVL